MCRFLVLILLCCSWFVLHPTAPAAPPADPPGAKPGQPEKGADADDQYRREAAEVVGGIELEMLAGGTWAKVKRIEKPLLFYGDPTRENDRGSVWGWGDKGRPVALLELFQSPNDRARWFYTICNTSGGKVRASLGGRPWWRENDSATEPKPIPGAPAPAADAKQRPLQLKQLARKFTAHEFWDPDNSRYELRRLDRPLHTYSDAAGGVLDGGLYVLANGTNPEILLFVEARTDPKDKSKSSWQFAVGRLSHAELHLEHDGKEVFNSPRGDRLSGWDKPYWLGNIGSKSDPGPGK